MAQGAFARDMVHVDYRPGVHVRWDPAAEAHITSAWETYVRTSRDTGITVYNGTLLRLDSFARTSHGLSLMLSDIEFRQCIGTGSTDFMNAFPHMPRANPFSVSVVLVTADGKIVVERRIRVNAYRRRYHVIAGFMEQELDAFDGAPHPFDALKREVREELGLILGTPVRATGLVNTVTGSELCSYCRLAVSFEGLLEIKEKAGTDCEIDSLETIPDLPSDVASFLGSHPVDMVPGGRACLLLYGREAYGEQWYDNTVERASSMPTRQPNEV